MRKLLSLVGLGLLACQGVPTDAPMMDAPQPFLAATTSTTNDIIPFSTGIFVPCALNGAGELVLVSGELHVLFHLTVSHSGNLTIKSHFQPQNIFGSGQTSGLKYRATGVTQQTQTVNGNPPWNFTFINNFRFIGQGPGNNYMVHVTQHVTVNANGDLTSVVDNSSTTCG
jgi:hypothetical protein